MAQNPIHLREPAPVVHRQRMEFGTFCSDPNNIAPAAFLLKHVADAKTDWHFTGPLTHKEYTIRRPSALECRRLDIRGLHAAPLLPETAKPINRVMAVATPTLQAGPMRTRSTTASLLPTLRIQLKARSCARVLRSHPLTAAQLKGVEAVPALSFGSVSKREVSHRTSTF